MATISASLKMFDMMSRPLQNMCNAMNVALNTMNDISNAANRNVDVKLSVSSAMENITQAQAQFKAFEEEINRQINVPPPKIHQWQSFKAPELFNTNGLERATQEFNSLNNMINKLQNNQQQLTNISSSMKILPDNAINDFSNANNKINSLFNSLKALEAEKNNLDSAGLSRLNSSVEQLREHVYETLNAQEKLNKAMAQGNLENINKSYINMMNNINKCEGHIRDNITQQDNFNNSLNKGTNEANNLLNKLKGFAGAYLGFQTIKKGIDLTINGAARLEQQLITISGMLGNKDVGKAFFSELNRYANISSYGLKEFATITRSFIQFTKNTDKLMNLNKTAEKLAFLDPSQGLEGAGFALKEALGGDFMSLKGRFGFGKADAEILKASKDMDDFINKFNKLLDSKGATNRAIQEVANSGISQARNFLSNIQTAFAQAGNSALEILKPLLSRINQGFKDGSFESFFSGIDIGLRLIVDLTMEVIDGFQWIGNVVNSNWSSIGPIIFGIAGSLMSYHIVLGITNIALGIHNTLEALHTARATLAGGATIFQATATQTATGAQIGLNTALWACPLTWIIGLVVGFIVALAAATAFSDKFRNGFANAFQGVANACATAFGAVVQTIENTLNWIIDKINALLSAVNTVTNATASLWGGSGTNFQLGKVNFGGFKSAGQNAIKSFGAAGAQMIKGFSADNIKNRIKNAMGLENKLKQPKMPNMAAWNKAQGPGTLSMSPDKDKLGKHAKGANDHLKNIDDKIDVSNEHLEMLRDLAQQESIQNFTTLSPTVQITTGDIKEEADIDKIISKIENYMENELVNSVEGVYA